MAVFSLEGALKKGLKVEGVGHRRAAKTRYEVFGMSFAMPSGMDYQQRHCGFKNLEEDFDFVGG